MIDVTTLLYFAGAWGMVFAGVLGVGAVRRWRRRRQPRPTAVDLLRADMRERRERESLRRAAATEYGHRRDRH